MLVVRIFGGDVKIAGIKAHIFAMNLKERD
jgi:hypothetical protein